MLPFGPAHLLWMALVVGGLILLRSSCGILRPITRQSSPALCSVSFWPTAELLVIIGNASGIAISFCVVAVWCFLKERFARAGVLCLAISLALKPHDTGLVWLYFLLAGGVYRKRALQTLAVFSFSVCRSSCGSRTFAPHWMQELHSNMSRISAHGGLNDPGPAFDRGRTDGMVIDLQSIISFFRDDPRFYNPASYLVCGSLLLAWSVRTLRSRFSQRGAWLALAAIAPLSMLPVYHRPYDAKLLLLTVPACAMLWAEGGRIGRLALLVNAAGFVLTGDLTWALILGPLSNLHLILPRLPGRYSSPRWSFQLRSSC